MKEPTVCIIILNWNGRADTDACLQSLAQIDYPNYTAVLVDNGSTDGSVAYFEQQYPEVEIIAHNENKGFTGGNNAGINYAKRKEFDYVLLLNNDTILPEPDFLSILVDACVQNKKIAMACPTIYYDKPDHKIWYAGGWLSLWRGWGHYQKKPGSEKIQSTGYTTGCCLLVKMDAINDIGMLNDAYFLSVEDVEWSLRAKKTGVIRFIYPRHPSYIKTAKAQGERREGTLRSEFIMNSETASGLFANMPMHFKKQWFGRLYFFQNLYSGAPDIYYWAVIISSKQYCVGQKTVS